MNRPAVILVLCGSSIATSTLAAARIADEAKKRNVDINIEKGKVSDASTLIARTKADIIVATATISERDDIPVFDGVPILTGIGKQDLFNQIFDCIANLKE